MKKCQLVWVLAVAGVLFQTGCAFGGKVYERGWIGGEYLEANSGFFKGMYADYFKIGNQGVIPGLPDSLKKQQHSAVFVSRLYEGTPATKAGMKEGDLVYMIDGDRVGNVHDFRRVIDNSKPGTTINMSLYRNGSPMNIPVVVGRETYVKSGYLSLGLRMGSTIKLLGDHDPVPKPDFNILNIVSLEDSDRRLELHSPEYEYYHSVAPRQLDPTAPNVANFEGWEIWLGIVGVSRYKDILSQKIVTPVGPVALQPEKGRARAAVVDTLPRL